MSLSAPSIVHPENAELIRQLFESLKQDGDQDGLKMTFSSSVAPSSGDGEMTYFVHQLYQLLDIPKEQEQSAEIQKPITLSNGTPLLAIGSQGPVVPSGMKQNGTRDSDDLSDRLWQGIPNLPAIQITERPVNYALFSTTDYLKMADAESRVVPEVCAESGVIPQVCDLLGSDSDKSVKRFLYPSQIIYQVRKLLAESPIDSTDGVIAIYDQLKVCAHVIQLAICCDPEDDMQVGDVLCADFTLFDQQMRAMELKPADMRPGSEAFTKLQEALFENSDLPQEVIETRIMASIVLGLMTPVKVMLNEISEYLEPKSLYL